jgi:hypothetical protein
MAKTFATLNPNAKDASLILSQGNQIVTTSAPNLTGEHMVLATIPKAVGHVYFETYFWSISRGNENGGTLLTGLAGVGVAELDAALNKYVGQEANTWGLRPFDGGIWNGGSAIVAGEPIAERTCLGTYVNFNSTSGPFLAFFTNGSFYASTFLPSDSNGNEFMVAAISLGCGPDAGDLSAFVNFGQRPFDTQPHGTNS